MQGPRPPGCKTAMIVRGQMKTVWQSPCLPSQGLHGHGLHPGSAPGASRAPSGAGSGTCGSQAGLSVSPCQAGRHPASALFPLLFWQPPCITQLFLQFAFSALILPPGSPGAAGQRPRAASPPPLREASAVRAARGASEGGGGAGRVAELGTLRAAFDAVTDTGEEDKDDVPWAAAEEKGEKEEKGPPDCASAWIWENPRFPAVTPQQANPFAGRVEPKPWSVLAAPAFSTAVCVPRMLALGSAVIWLFLEGGKQAPSAARPPRSQLPATPGQVCRVRSSAERQIAARAPPSMKRCLFSCLPIPPAAGQRAGIRKQ